MFNTLCVIKNPAGTYSYVGSIPRDLGKPVPATTSDVAGGRAFRGFNDELMVTRFPTFTSHSDAVQFAVAKGYAVAE